MHLQADIASCGRSAGRDGLVLCAPSRYGRPDRRKEHNLGSPTLDRSGRLQPIPTAMLVFCVFVAGGCGVPIPPNSAGEADHAPTFCSLDARYGFGSSGGLSLSRDQYLLIPPDTFRVNRSYRFGQAETICTTTVPACSTPDRIDLGELRAALDHPDVRDAWEATVPTVHGADFRPVDGGIWAMQREDALGHSARVLLGADCRGSTSCNPIPPGLLAVRELLSSLAEQELATQACAASGT